MLHRPVLILDKTDSTIAAVENCTQHYSLFTTIGDGEVIRELIVPPRIYALEHVHEEEESDED